MTRITLDAATADKLQAADHPVEVCNPSGKVIGRFTPTFDPSEWEPITPDVTEEELDRREREEESYSTEEMLAYLESLKCSESEGASAAMPRIMLDATAADKLRADQIVDVCDPSGKVIGRFTPAFDPSEWEPWEPEIDEEELQRREQSDKWYTTEQVLAHLKSLEQQ
jgi:hypothetical protein